MTWVKLDDKLHGHRKARLAGVEAMGLWALAASWVGEELTDGFVPASVLFRWARNPLELAEKLEHAGLWSPTVHLGEEGWLFHDWLDYNPSRAEVEARREVERAKKQRQRAAEKRPAGTPSGTPEGGPGNGIDQEIKDLFPDTSRESPGDNAHAFDPDANGDCRHCPLPARHPRHRALRAV